MQPLFLPPTSEEPPTFAQLTEVFQSRGFDYLPTETAQSYICQALDQLYDEDYWPFLEVEADGTDPLVIPDLRQVLSVRRLNAATNGQLPWVNRQVLERAGVDMEQEGTPRNWYRQSDTTIRTWPVSSTDPLRVRYIFVPPCPENDDDTTLVPRRYRMLISYIAERLAYEDSDNYDLAQQADARYKEGLQRMRQNLLYPNLDTPDYVQTFRSDGV